MAEVLHDPRHNVSFIGKPSVPTNTSKIDGAIKVMIKEYYPQLSEAESDIVAKEVNITNLQTRVAYSSTGRDVPTLHPYDTNISASFIDDVLTKHKLGTMNKDTSQSAMSAVEYHNRMAQLKANVPTAPTFPRSLPGQVASLDNIFEVNEKEYNLFSEGTSKENIIKLIRGIKNHPRLTEGLGKTDLAKSIYVDLTRVSNLPEMIRAASEEYMKGHTDVQINLDNVRLPMLVYMPDIEYGHGTGGDSVEFTLAKDRNAVMIISKSDVGYRTEFYCVAKSNPKAPVLMDVFSIPESGDKCVPCEGVYKYNFPKASREDIERFSTLNQATTITIINMINHYHLAALGQPSKLKLRNVSPMLHPYHRPHVIIPAPYKHTVGIDDLGIVYDPAKLMETFMTSLENDDGFYDDTIPFIMPFDEVKVAYTPLLFQFLPFQKFTIIDEHFLPTDGGRFYVTYNHGDIRIGMCAGNDFTFEIAHLTKDSYGKDAEGNLIIKKFDIVESTSGKVADEKYSAELATHVRFLASSLAAFLIHYSNLEPAYHVDPTPANKRVLQHDMSLEVDRITKRVSVVKLAHPRKLRYAGHLGGTHASPIEHVRRGHWRSYKSGKRTWVEDTTVNKGKGDKLNKVYVLEGETTVNRDNNSSKDLSEQLTKELDESSPRGVAGEIDPALFAKPINEGYIPSESTGDVAEQESKDRKAPRRFPLYVESREGAIALTGEDPNLDLAKAIYESSKD